jgi:type I restriction enzyme R subunit
VRVPRGLAIWYHQSFAKAGSAFRPGPFVTPADPSTPLRELQDQIGQLRAELGDSRQQLESNQQLSELLAREKNEYATFAEQMDEEARTYEQLALEHEAQLAQTRVEFEGRLLALQEQLNSHPKKVQQEIDAYD